MPALRAPSAARVLAAAPWALAVASSAVGVWAAAPGRDGGNDADAFRLPCRAVALEEVARASGIGFVHHRGASPERHLPETMGSGVAWLDYDGDGWWDLYAVQSGPFPPDGGPLSADRLYRNRGDGRFEAVTLAAAGGDRGYGQGAVAADVDGDGDPDLYLTNYGGDRLLDNRGDGRFADATAASGLASSGWSSSAAFADADGDADLDLYVARYVDYDPGHDLFCGDPATGERDYCDISLFAGQRDLYFENLGGGRFREAGPAAGLADAEGRGLGVLFTDLDGDLRPEIYVANDLNPNFLFRNLGGGRFQDVSLPSGAAVNLAGKPEAGMGLAVGDVDGDADPDLAVTNFDVETNTLYENLGDLQFEDVSAKSGFGPPSYNLLGFGIVAADLDLDGDLDVYVANGHVFERPRRDNVSYAEPGLLLAGDGRGRFVAEACGVLRDGPAVARGLAAADYDQDGDPDLAVANSDGPLALLRNGTAGRPWLGVHLQGAAPNSEAVGARLTLRSRRGGTQPRWVLAGDSYQSSSDRRLLWGWREGDGPDSLEIAWPSGRRQRLQGLAAGAYLVFAEPGPSPRAPAADPLPPEAGVGDLDAALDRLLVDPPRFAADPAFRAQVVARLARLPDRPWAAAVQERLLEALNRLPELAFADSEAIEVAWGAAARPSLGRRLPYEAGALAFAADTEGRLVASLYSLSSTFFSGAEALRLLSAVRQYDPGRVLLALVDPPLARELGPAAAQLRLVLLPTYGRPYSPWPRDPLSFVRRDGRLELLVRPNLQPGREEDAFMAAEVVQNLPEALDRAWGPVAWRQAPVPFHNGQVLLAPGAAWVSLHSLEAHLLRRLGLERVPVASLATPAGVERYAAAARQAAAELAELYGRPVRFVHPLAADRPEEGPRLFAGLAGGAGFDLDSLVTLLPGGGGAPRALVGDPSAGQRLLAELPPAEWEALAEGYGLAPRGAVLAAALQAAQQAPRVAGLDGFLDLVAGHLERQGFAVARLPLLLVPVALLAEREGLTHPDFLLTWNNVVVETRGGEVRAEGFASLLPTGDARALATFRAAGCELTLLPPLPRSVILGGGYRCASNHLREP